MATTQNTYTGDGSTTDYTLTFPYLAVADVRVSLDDVGTTAFSLINATTLRFNSAPGNGVAIRIYRVTSDSHRRIVFTPGSTIKADDLNDAHSQSVFLAQELSNIVTSVSAGAVADGSIVSSKIADNSIISQKISNDAIITSKLADDSVSDSKLTDTGVTPGSYSLAGITVNAQGRITSASSGTAAFAQGMIMMFQGATAPTGWAFCDGQNGTPDLRDRFIVGSGSTYSLNATGGSADATLVAHSHTVNNHNHTFSANTSSNGLHNHSIDLYVPSDGDVSGARRENSADGPGADGTTSTSDAGNHFHSVSGTTSSESPSTNSQGSSATDANLPPYYALAFIIKL